jgi:hypothetical protein
MAETIHFKVDKSCSREDDANMVQTALYSLAGFKQLYLNLGRSYEMLVNQAETQRYDGLAAESVVTHQAE